MAETKDLPPTETKDLPSVETRNLPSYDPEEANRELRAMLRENLQEGRKRRDLLVGSQVVVALATAALLFFNARTVSLTQEQVAAVRDATQQAQQQFNRTIQQAQEQFNLSPNLATTSLPPVGTEDDRTGSRRRRHVPPVVHASAALLTYIM